LETSDIYFITGLSRRGKLVNLYESQLIGARISSLLAKHYLEALKSKSGKIETSSVEDLTLRVLLLAINKVARSEVEHENNNSKFLYAIDCTTPMTFN